MRAVRMGFILLSIFLVIEARLGGSAASLLPGREQYEDGRYPLC